MDITERVWNDLATTKYQAIYASIFNLRVRKLSDGINIFTAFVSSASVGGWAIWSDYSAAWGILIAASQFLNLAKPYIPQIRDNELYHELQLYYLERHYELDDLWLQISLGDLTESQIKEEYRRIYEKFFNLSKKFLKVRIEKSDKLVEKAEQEWNESLQQYGIKTEN